MVTFDEMAANFEQRFGVTLSVERKSAIERALGKEDYATLNRLTGLSSGIGDHECPISAWGRHGMDHNEARDELNRRVREAIY